MLDLNQEAGGSAASNGSLWPDVFVHRGMPTSEPDRQRCGIRTADLIEAERAKLVPRSAKPDPTMVRTSALADPLVRAAVAADRSAFHAVAAAPRADLIPARKPE